jgi:uncharacterized repeat protein (TIGR03803 family)
LILSEISHNLPVTRQAQKDHYPGITPDERTVIMTSREYSPSAGRRSPATRWTVVLAIAFALVGASSAAQTYSVIHTFTAGEGGPTENLIRDSQGNLYGTTTIAGDLSCNSGQGCGTVFKLTPQGEFDVLYSFGETSNDGLYPE